MYSRKISAYHSKLNHRTGFTIVELLIVIVIIGILSAITIVSYSSIQTSSRNQLVKNGAKKLVIELQRFEADTSKTPLQTGGGWGGTGSGFVSSQYSDPVNYPLAVETVLRNANYLPAGFTSSLPANKKYGDSMYTLMLYGCGSDYVVYYSLESPSSSDVSDYSNVISQCSNAATVQTNYNMQGGIIFS